MICAIWHAICLHLVIFFDVGSEAVFLLMPFVDLRLNARMLAISSAADHKKNS